MNSVQVADPKTNFIDLSHDVKTSYKMGYLIPSPPIDFLPGDNFRLGAQSLSRFAPMVAPVMHRFDIRHEYFFVPYRLLWANWDKWITQTEVAGDLPAAPTCLLLAGTPADYRLPDYLGLPTPIAFNSETVSALFFAAYQFIYNEYYRDQNLIDEVNYKLDDGDNSDGTRPELFVLRKRAWEKDYFTACLPFAQKGDPVMIPIGSQQVVLDPLAGDAGQVRQAVGHGLISSSNLESGGLGVFQTDNGGLDQDAVYDPNGTLITEDTGEATSINDLRLAYALQRLKEKLARGGSRLTEFLKVVFGVMPEDSRLDRPEYITGVKTPLVVSEVLNTTGTDELPQGNMSGHGVGVANGYNGHYNVKEHGCIICINSVIPRTAYQQGINRMWLKYNDPTEVYTPDMAHIGEQTVFNREIYAFQGLPGGEEFGYMPRFAEHRTQPSVVTGEFRTTLDFYHDGRIFATPPALNQEFVECTPDTRIFAVEDGVDYIYSHIYHEVKVSRKIPKFGTPSSF